MPVATDASIVLRGTAAARERRFRRGPSWFILEEVPPSAPSNHEPEQKFRELRRYVPADILDVSFPVSVRGYDRSAVDAYIKRVNRVIAELKVSASPPAAVRHALDQAEEKVDALLEAARQAAEQITASAREDAEQTTGRAKAEAAELVVNTTAQADQTRAEAADVLAKAKAEAEETVRTAKAAAEETVRKARAEADETMRRAKDDAGRIVADANAEAHALVTRSQAEADERMRQLKQELATLREQAEARMREIRADTDTLWRERHDLLGDIHGMASSLAEIANAAAKRVAPTEPTKADDEATADTDDAMQEPTRAMAALGADRDGDADGTTNAS